MLRNQQRRIEHGVRIARQLLAIHADRLRQRVGAVEGRVVAGGAAGAAVGRDAGFEEQLAAELDPRLRVRIVIDMRGVGQRLEDAQRTFEQAALGVFSRHEARTGRAGSDDQPSSSADDDAAG